MAASSAIAALAQPTSPLTYRGGVGFSTTSYDESAASRSNTVSRSFGIQGSFSPRLHQVLAVRTDLGWEYLGPVCLDLGEEVDCARSTEEQTSAVFASIGAAIYTPPVRIGSRREWTDTSLVLGFGREWVWAGIGDDGCINCTIERVGFDGGLYLEPGLEFTTNHRIGVEAAYRFYESRADLSGKFILRIQYLTP